jgi:hypothetical protein
VHIQKLAACGRLMMLVGLSMTSGACATMIAGTTQDVYVQTDPAGADCKIDRQGASVGVVRPTPGRVNVSRSRETIIISCTHDGYQQADEVVASSFSGATVGNILLGGVIGLAVDAASGANNKYPDRVIIVMTPESFPSTAARDTFFEGVKERLATSADTEIKQIQAGCNSNNKEICNGDVKKLTDARDKALADLDNKRLSAKITAKS